MKINVLYFSSTGNTLWLIEEFKKNVSEMGHGVRTFDVITENGQWEDDCDLLGIIYPVWCSDLPLPIENRVNNMKAGENTKIFLLGNAGAFSGDTGRHWVRKFKANGYDVYYANHVLLPVNTCFPKFSMFKVPDEKKKAQMQKEASSRLKSICNDIVKFNRFIEGKSLIDKLGGYGQRLKWYKGLMRGRVREMYIDTTMCSNCKLCYRMCPTGAIHINDQLQVEISEKSKCIFCVKCYNLCPLNAVLIEEKSKSIEKYGRYKGPDKKFKPIVYR